MTYHSSESNMLPLDPKTLGSVSELAGREVGFDDLAQPLLAALTA